MALFLSYAPPGVYTQTIIQSTLPPALGSARIPVIIGEGSLFNTFNNIELFRGSSAVQDDQAVAENISNQVTGLTRSFQTTYFPVVDGTGKGVTTNDPSKIQAQATDTNGNTFPVTVISLTGATGQFQTQDIVPAGYSLYITYNFKRGDTYIGANSPSGPPYNVPENLLPQVPSYASLVIAPSVGNSVTVSTTVPGELGNLVTIQFVTGVATPDAQAVSGAGSDAITINITKPGPATRTLQDLVNLINAGIPTLDAGYLTVSGITGVASTALVAGGAVPLAGGSGPSSNTVFAVKHAPITDGTNGGVTTTNPANVLVQLNGSPVGVLAVDGQNGLVTLAQPVPANAISLTISYYFNTWKNTFDLLPASHVSSITQVGLGPNRQDYIQGTDYVLGVDADGNGTINWGASVSEAIGVSAAGESANFTPAEVLATLVDEHLYLRPVTGAVNGKNTVFALEDTPVDGSGLSVTTDDPSLINVYVGSDPLEAFLAGPVRVARLNGNTQQVTLYNPPASGNGVWASYYGNNLTDHQYSVTVVSPGYAGAGTFTVADELGRVAPLVIGGTNTVAASAAFAITGVVYPFVFSAGNPLQTGDAQAQAGAAVDETVTLTFNHDGNNVLVPASQATVTVPGSSGTLTFTASTPGTGGNHVSVAIDVTTQNPIPVVVNGDQITIYAFWNGSLNTNAQIAGFFPSGETPDGGQITATFTAGNPQVTAATNLAGGTNAVTVPVTHSYTVSSTNSKGSGSQGSNVGYLDQTYIDVATGFRVTIVNPADASNPAFGGQSLPAGGNYAFAPGDTLQYIVKADATGANAAIRNCGSPGVAPSQANTLVCIGGLKFSVVSNFGSTTGDSVIVSTFNKSGNNPSVGEFYYVSFQTEKQASDLAIHIYTNPTDAYAAYGAPSTINRLSLGIQFMVQNGVQTFGAIQVPQQPGSNLASDADYIAAIQSLTVALPGSTNKANGIIPLSTSPTVHQFLSNQLITQATIRNKGEAIGFVGYDQFTTPAIARANARALHNSRMLAIGMPLAGVEVTDSQTGVTVEYPVDGPFMAAALCGLEFNPANDVATTLTNQNLVGFSRLLITYDDPTMDQMAADGLICLKNNSGSLLVRHYKSTDPSNPITSEPTCTTIADFTAQAFRADLAQFIGRKIVDSLITDITLVCNARLQALLDNQIISGYQNLAVVPDPTDPTTVDVTVTYKPIFSLLYLSVVFTVTTTL